ncbi:hypothetical protein RvY_16061 [Ramazzottius varieornatus]|uniref:THAP-type domain-containing protein n=1 Tax=Ramazzottius varieornatus TaxID=947166 RepID=A0A1D1W4Y0_RAMVA|nr:hypothetical protein RvY_16061 [Ramazzottius varieornatus]
MSAPGQRRCWVKDCIVDEESCPSITLHHADKQNEYTRNIWKRFCDPDPAAVFPERDFYVCQLHFPAGCHYGYPERKLRANAIPTIRALTEAGEPIFAEIKQTPLRTSGRHGGNEYTFAGTNLPGKIQRATNEWSSFEDLRRVLRTVKVPNNKWLKMDFPQMNPPKVSFECVENGKSVKSVSFAASLLATISIANSQSPKEQTLVHSKDDLQILLARVEGFKPRPCGCVLRWLHIKDLKEDIARIRLPSPFWYATDLTKLQYQIVFQCLEDSGRTIRSVSFSADLQPRVHMRNVPCEIEDEENVNFKEEVRCIHDVEKVLKAVEKRKICKTTDDGPPAREDNYRDACMVALPKEWNGKAWKGMICPACRSAKSSRGRRKRKPKADNKRTAEEAEVAPEEESILKKPKEASEEKEEEEAAEKPVEDEEDEEEAEVNNGENEDSNVSSDASPAEENAEESE